MVTILMSGLLGAETEADAGSEDTDMFGDDDAGLLDDGLGFEDGDDDEDFEDLEYRLDDVEREVQNLEGTVESVRSENESVSEAIENVEGNVEKLVELYEIVTQGINPFVGDQEIGSAFESALTGGADGAFGEDIDDEITGASASDFLDDPLDDEPTDEFDEGFDAGGHSDEGDPFDPLDEEFDDEIAPGDEADVDSLDDESDPDGLDDPVGPDDWQTDSAEEGVDGDPASESAGGDPIGGLAPGEPAVDAGENGDGGDLPYLVAIPSRVDAEMAALEWVESMVAAVGIDGAAQSIAYYESLGWIAPDVERHLQRMLSGFGDESRTPPADPEPCSILSAEDHRRSLEFVAHLATPEREPRGFVNGEPTPIAGDGSGGDR